MRPTFITRCPYLKLRLAVMTHLQVKIYTVIFICDVWVYSQISVSLFFIHSHNH